MPRRTIQKCTKALPKQTKSAIRKPATDRSGVGQRLFKNATRVEAKEKEILRAHSDQALRLAGTAFDGIQGRWLNTTLSDEEDVRRHLSSSPWVVNVSDGVFFAVERARMEQGRLQVQGSIVPTSVKKKDIINAAFTVDHVACQQVAPLRMQ